MLVMIMSTITACNGQNQNDAHEAVNQTDDLGKSMAVLGNNIWQIFQDKTGDYWFGTNGQGIIRYDGHQLTQYTTDDGLIYNSIRSIKEDHNGHLFVGTPDGVSKFNGKTFETLQPYKKDPDNWQLSATDLWFNCNGNSLYRYDGMNLQALRLPEQDLKKAFDEDMQGVPFENMNNSPYAVYGINKDREGNLWLGTVSAGAFRYDGTSFLWIAEKELSTLPDGRVPGVRSMLEDKDGFLWLSNFKSKYKITTKDGETTYEKTEGVAKSSGLFDDRLPYFNAGLADMDGTLWMTTYTGGVWHYDGKKLMNIPVMHDGKPVSIISIYKDNDGTLWLGSDNTGALKYNGTTFEKFLPNLDDKTNNFSK